MELLSIRTILILALLANFVMQVLCYNFKHEESDSKSEESPQKSGSQEEPSGEQDEDSAEATIEEYTKPTKTVKTGVKQKGIETKGVETKGVETIEENKENVNPFPIFGIMESANRVADKIGAHMGFLNSILGARI